ncbi:33 kDa chaperonin [compost metagenome]
MGEDFTYYFAVSEQTPSAVGLGVLVDTDSSVIVAGGFIVQLLPGLSDEEINAIEQAVGQMPPVTSLLDQGMELDEMLRRLLPDIQILERMDIHFSCQCSLERVERTLISLGKDELTTLLEDEETEVVCDFCNEPYTFSNVEIEALIEQMDNK